MSTDDIVQIVKTIADKLDDLMKKNKKENLYIHCYEGVSRSAICVMYYLVKYHGYPFTDRIKNFVNSFLSAFSKRISQKSS
jgi:protein-tyrosine phosphatase